MSDEKKKNVKMIVTYQSGRQEKFVDKVKTDGTYSRKFQKRLTAMESFPSVVNIKLERF